MTTVEPESQRAREERQRHERFQAKQAEKEAKAAKIAARKMQLERATEQNPRRERPHVLLRTDPEQIEAIVDTLNLGVLPEVYVSAGQVVEVETPSGAVRENDEPTKAPVIVDGHRLRRMLATNTYTHRLAVKRVGDETVILEEECLPTIDIAKSALATGSWPKLRPLLGIATTPFLRTDGSLVQESGYDAPTGYIYEPLLDIEQIPDRPTDDELRAARTFVLDDLLGNFPWVDDASKANYVAMLITPILRTYLKGALVPLLAVDAKSHATGKTLLCQIIIKLFSGCLRAWVEDDRELHKVITSILVERSGAAVLLDNVERGTTVSSPTLATLLTARVWSDRELGRNDAGSNVKAPNNRIWMVSGNNLSIGGDIPSRSVLTQLDAKMPNPELRPTSEFRLGNLEEWIESPANLAVALRHLLILARGWINAGAQVIETPMRQFTTWASAVHGFVDWLGMKGFAANRSKIGDHDPEAAMWGAFYASWWRIYGDQHVTATTLVQSATPNEQGYIEKDWGETFLRSKIGRLPVASGLGRMLQPEVGSWKAGFQLLGEQDGHSKVWSFWLAEATAQDVAGGPAGGAGGRST